MNRIILLVFFFPLLTSAQVDSILYHIGSSVSFEGDTSIQSQYKKDQDADYNFSIRNDTLIIDTELIESLINQLDGTVYDITSHSHSELPLDEIGKIKVKTSRYYLKNEPCDTCFVEFSSLIITGGINCEKPFKTSNQLTKERDTRFLSINIPRVVDTLYFQQLAEYVANFNEAIIIE